MQFVPISKSTETLSSVAMSLVILSRHFLILVSQVLQIQLNQQVSVLLNIALEVLSTGFFYPYTMVALKP